MKNIFCVISVFFLTGCQSFGWIQYHFKSEDKAMVLAVLREVAKECALEDRYKECGVKGCLAFYKIGDNRVFSSVGARLIGETLSVDIFYRSYNPLMTPDDFEIMAKSFSKKFETQSGRSVHPVEPKNQIPLNFKTSQTCEWTHKYSTGAGNEKCEMREMGTVPIND